MFKLDYARTLLKLQNLIFTELLFHQNRTKRDRQQLCTPRVARVISTVVLRKAAIIRHEAA